MSSKVSHNIKHRTNAKDVFITPKKLAKKAINMCKKTAVAEEAKMNGEKHKCVWYDPFKNTGNYYNQFPDYGNGVQHEWSEILEGKDFFEFNGKIDVICSNPPYSMLDKVFKKCIELKPYCINLLLGVGNLTARRIEWMQNAGYGITKLHMCKVFSWYGMSYIVQWEKGQTSIMSFDRKVWREEEPKKEEPKCCFEECDNELGKFGGNNPSPLFEEIENARCCDACNMKVIIARMT